MPVPRRCDSDQWNLYNSGICRELIAESEHPVVMLEQSGSCRSPVAATWYMEAVEAVGGHLEDTDSLNGR